MKLSRKFLFSQLFVLVVVGAYLALYFWKKHEPLPVLGEVGSFQLTDSEGKLFPSEELKNRVWIANFIFTSCRGPCPQITKQMQWYHRSFKMERDIKLVSFSTDPETDTPPRLKSYAKKYEADPKSWHFLTGPREELSKVSRQDFKLAFPEDEPETHSTRLVLVDRKGKIRGYYDSTDRDSRNQLFTDAAHLVHEP